MKTILQTKLSRTMCAVLFIMGMFASVNTKAQCTASFYSIPDSLGSGVTFVNTSIGVSGSTSYAWTFGDGSSATGASQYHPYASSGWYLVCLVISDKLGSVGLDGFHPLFKYPGDIN